MTEIKSPISEEHIKAVKLMSYHLEAYIKACDEVNKFNKDLNYKPDGKTNT
jgi:hypothetical protein